MITAMTAIDAEGEGTGLIDALNETDRKCQKYFRKASINKTQ